MKWFTTSCLSLIFLACGQANSHVDFSFLHTNTNANASVEEANDEPSPWISRKELLEYIKNAPRIERTEGIISPFDSLDYNQIIAYKFWNSGERNPKVYNGFLVKEIENQVALNQVQADKVLRLLNKKSTYGGIRAACYEPRFGLVFYKDGKMVTQINICMECNFLKSDVEIPVYEKQKSKGESVPIEKFRTKHDYGFSKKGWEALVEFQRELGFPIDWEN